MQSVKAKLLGFVMFLVYWTMRATWRTTFHHPPEFQKLLDEKKQFVIGLWHGEEIALIQCIPKYGASAMVSMSFDGEAVATMIHLLGAPTARGSSSKGSTTAIKGILRMARAGHRPAITVDGPRGPRHVVKPGIVEIARLLKLPIVTASSAVDKVHVNDRSWNKGEIPHLFSRIAIAWSEPLYLDETKSIEDHLPLVAASIAKTREQAAIHLKERLSR